MTWTYPGQMFDNTLTPLKGYTAYNLDIQGRISTNVNLGGIGSPVPSGRVIHVSALNTVVTNGIATGPNEPVFEMGCNLGQMACFLWPGSTDFDVTNPGVPAGVALGGTSTNKPSQVPVFPTGVVFALVAVGGYELETTEFDTALTYAPNDGLRAVTRDTSADAGKLTNRAATASSGAGQELNAAATPTITYTDTIVARVSRGKYTNADGITALAFWPVHLPGTR